MFKQPDRRPRDTTLVVTLVALGLGYIAVIVGWLLSLD